MTPQQAEALKRTRESIGLTRRELAQFSGCSAATISDLEMGRNDNPSHEKMVQLYRALKLRRVRDVTLETIFSYSDVLAGYALPRHYPARQKRPANLPATLAEYMLIANVNQFDLAAMLGVSQSAVSCWISGARVPLARHALQLHQMTGVPLETLLSDHRSSVPARTYNRKFPSGNEHQETTSAAHHPDTSVRD